MRDLRAFLRRHIEAFLDHEFGTGMQNATPPGCRRPVWTSDHTQRLVDHLAANWKPIKVAPHTLRCTHCNTRFTCLCDNSNQPHMCPRCDDAAEESKGPGSPLHYNREGYLASGKIDDESSPLPRQFLSSADPKVAPDA